MSRLTYDQGRAVLDILLTELCSSCQGTGKMHDAQGKLIPCTNEYCNDGKVLNGLGDALVEFITDHVTAFAERDHGHYIGRHE